MTHWHQMPPAGQALRPTEEEAKKLVAEGNTWIEKHWKPMPGNLKRKADEAGLTEDPLKVERSKRLVAQRLNTRLRARLEPLEEENEALKEEIARLKAAMQQSGPARATHGSTEEVKSSAPPVANRGDLGTTQGGMDRLTENLVDRLAAVEAMLRIQRQDQLPAVEAAVWAPDVDRHIEIKEEPASPVTNWSDLGATHAGGDPFAAAGTVLENDQVAVKQNVGEGPRGDSLEAAEAVLSPRREDE